MNEEAKEGREIDRGDNLVTEKHTTTAPYLDEAARQPHIDAARPRLARARAHVTRRLVHDRPPRAAAVGRAPPAIVRGRGEPPARERGGLLAAVELGAHCVRLAGAGLAVRHRGARHAREQALDERRDAAGVERAARRAARLGAVDGVKGKGLAAVFVDERHAPGVARNAQQRRRARGRLGGAHRAHVERDADVGRGGLRLRLRRWQRGGGGIGGRGGGAAETARGRRPAAAARRPPARRRSGGCAACGRGALAPRREQRRERKFGGRRDDCGGSGGALLLLLLLLLLLAGGWGRRFSLGPPLAPGGLLPNGRDRGCLERQWRRRRRRREGASGQRRRFDAAAVERQDASCSRGHGAGFAIDPTCKLIHQGVRLFKYREL